MQGPNQNHAEAMAKALAAAGIKSDEPPPKPVVRALSAAHKAYFDIDEGSPADWRDVMELRKSSEALRKESDRKLAALCSRVLSQLKMPESEMKDLYFAWGYFSKGAE